MPKGLPGKPKSPEHREKLRLAAKRRFASPEARNAQRERMQRAYREQKSLQKMHSLSANDARSKTLTEKWQDDQYRTHMLIKRREPEIREQTSISMKEKWANEEYRHQRLQHLQSPQHRARQQAQAKRQWTDPIRRERIYQRYRQSVRRHLTLLGQQYVDDPQWLALKNQTLNLQEISELCGCSPSFISHQFTKFGLIPQSHPTQYGGGEDRIVEFLKDIRPILRRDRRTLAPREIDIYLPTHSLGIEYHGSYWHSYNAPESHDERYRHYWKWEQATQRGIRLLQFWDYEWEHHPEICQSIINNALGRSRRVGARTFTIGIPSVAEVSTFLSAHHIQGPCTFSTTRGLFDRDGKLWAVMTMGPSRFQRGMWELLRFAVHRGWTIHGAAQRLWKCLLREIPPNVSIISYADNRLFTGQMYENLGFTKSHITSPGYQYWRSGVVYSRWQFQKRLLKDRLPIFDSTLTEAENMFRNGFRRLWDAGQSVWMYIPSTKS